MSDHKIEEYIERLGHLSAPMVIGLIEQAGLSPPSAPSVRRILSGDPPTRITRRMEHCFDAALEQLAEQDAPKPQGVIDYSGNLRAPIPVPIVGKTHGLNIVHPLDVTDSTRSVSVPLFADESRFVSYDDMPLRAVMFTRPIFDADESINSAIDGMSAIFDISRPTELDKIYRGRRGRLMAVIQAAHPIPELTERGAKAETPTVCCWVSLSAASGSLILENASGVSFSALVQQDIGKLWTVISLIP